MWYSLFSENRDWLVGMGVVSVVMLVGSLILLPVLVVRMRADYLISGGRAADSFAGRHPVLRWTLLILKNLLGLILLVLGLAMLLGPGQGVLTVLL